MADKPLDLVKCPQDVSSAIDNFVELNRQIKKLERRQQRARDIILDYGKKVRADRIALGYEDVSFKLEGMVSAVTYVCADDSASISLAEFDKLAKEFGSIARRLLEIDYQAFRFDHEVLRENFDAVLTAIAGIPNGVGERIVKPLPLTLRSGWVENLKGNRDSGFILKILDRFRPIVKLQDG
jgi:hypothetical protein